MNLLNYLADVKDFPKKGIIFKDISPLLNDGTAYNYAINEMIKKISDVDVIVSPEARGFIFGCPVATKMSKSFVMVRKPNKLPGECFEQHYDLEYGQNVLQIQKNLIKPGQKVAIVDDILATGGTTEAIIKLVEQSGGKVTDIVVLLELSFLNGKEYLKKYDVNIHSLLKN
ncbi:adenine phosphoribosyltransferase [Mycoplasmopsis gallinarum]|uniref:adenine phosphoribosyltransferase n=1 Tax=Mycoplasmopsis gallinarum TaxID=29557 RepID=UPI00047F573C|nr:adenine phosphoribosyltransferase [Mycoplasmopsis gallinarum]